MSDLPHLRIPSNQSSEDYTYAGGMPQGGGVFDRPVRNKPAHGAQVRVELEAAQTRAGVERTANRQAFPQLVNWDSEGVTLTFHGDPNFELKLDSLERMGAGIHLLSCKIEGNVQVAKVFVPEGSLNEYLKLVNEYANSLLTVFEAPEHMEQHLRNLADPDNGVKVFGQVRKADGQVKVQFLISVAQEAPFLEKAG